MIADSDLGKVTREIDELMADRSRGNKTAEDRPVLVPSVLWSAMKRVILEKELRSLALTDDLTCLYNRRGFFAAATQQLRFARRNVQDIVLFLCDVDNLAQINNSFGRAEGDFALVRTADALEEAFRDSDLLARLGGDAFVALASGTSGNDRDAVLRRLEACFQRTNANEPRYRLSVSVGTAHFDPHQPAGLSDLLEQADYARHVR
ncbi:MAG: GGDEF domain-containing protein [Candidatus Acidiferrales bacterium]